MSNQSRLALPAFVLAVAMAVVVGTALGFEHIGGYIPCKLCLEQRVPYYAGVPIALLAALAAMFKAPAMLPRALLVAAGLAMAYALYLGIYHSGVEWSWWAGPADCTATGGGAISSGKDLLSQIDTVKPPNFRHPALVARMGPASVSGVSTSRLSGSSTVKRDPCPGWLLSETVPPWSSARLLTMERPRPAPR